MIGWCDMKRIFIFALLVSLLFGCSSNNDNYDCALQLRNKLLVSETCRFDTRIIADYGDSFCTFLLHNEIDNRLNLKFTVLEPDTISGISGTISQDGGGVTFDDKVLLFQLLMDQELTPVCAPWLLYKTLVGGIINAEGSKDGLTQVIYDDVFSSEPYQAYVMFNSLGVPSDCEFVWNGRRFLTIEVSNFEIV